MTVVIGIDSAQGFRHTATAIGPAASVRGGHDQTASSPLDT